MRAVSRFESNLLRIVYGLLGRTHRAEVLPLLSREVDQPPCLGRDAVGLLQAALAKRCVGLLARAGWRRERFLRDQRPVEGRLWQRARPEELALSFSRNSMEFLLWLTARNPAADDDGWPHGGEPMTTGDRFLLFLVYRAVHDTEIAPALRRHREFAIHGLCRLSFADEFADVPRDVPINFDAWTDSAGALILEALQQELADRWRRIERSKAKITRPERMEAIGASQERVLNAWFDAMEARQRQDLARFVLMAGQRLLRPEAAPADWIGRLDLDGLAMSQRCESYRQAFVFLRALERLQRWERQARAVGYFDEGYAASQLWKADWERFEGDRSCAAAGRIVRQADPLHSRPARPADGAAASAQQPERGGA